MGIVVGGGTYAVVGAGVHTCLVGHTLGCTVVVLVVLEVQEVRLRTLPDMGEFVLGEMHELMSVVRAEVYRIWLEP